MPIITVSVLVSLARIVADEAETNANLKRRLEEVLSPDASRTKARTERAEGMTSQRPKNRRSAAVIDPIAIARTNPDALKEQLSKLSLDQLRDIVAEFGMDPGKLVMKWKEPAKVADRIFELAVSRAQKGNAFRSYGQQTGEGNES